MARGAAWMIGFRVAERGLGFISLLILVRLLVPEDFGLVAMAMSVVALIELAGAFGFDTALIQHRDPQRSHFDSAFTMNALVGLGCAAALALLAYPTATYFDEPRLVAVMQVLAVAWALQGFENVGTVMFRRNMEFHREFVFLTSKRLLGFVATLIAAFALRSYWALVIGIVTGRIAAVFLSFIVHPYRPRLSLAAIRELMSFSFWLFLGNILGFFILRLSTFVIGRFESSRELGYYTVAYEIGTLPTSELLAPINRAIIPGFARMARDPTALRAGFLDVMSATTLFAVPAAFGIAAIAEPLVHVLLTDKWADIVPLLQVLAFLGAVAAILSSAYPAFYALGRPKIAVGIASVRIAIVLPAMIAGATMFGVIGVAWADLAAALLTLPVSIAVACRVLAVPIKDLLRRIWRPFLASLLMFLLVRSLLNQLGVMYPDASGLPLLLSGIGLGIAVYAMLIASLWLASGRGPGAEEKLLELLRHRRQ